MKNNNNRNLFSPRNDHYFKRMFGDERNRKILINFLMETTEMQREECEGLQILDTETRVEYNDDKFSVMDVKVRTKSGKIVDIEIQRFQHKAFKSRIVYNEAKMIEEQLHKGVRYDMIHQAICIVISEFAFLDEDTEYHHKYELYDPRTGSTFSDIMCVHIFELEKLPESDSSENSGLLDWLRFLNSDEVDEMEPIAEKNSDVREAVELYKELIADEDERRLAEKVLERAREEWSITEYARDEGHEAGLEEGLAKGEKKGLAKGEKKATFASAKRMKADGIETALICKYTGLSEEEVKDI